MPWVRYDDQASINRKVAPLTDAAYRLWREATEWSSRNLTDGRIGKVDLAEISKRGKPKLAAELVSRDLWHTADHVCPSETCPPPGPDGWVIHDYWDYQPAKEDVLAERERKAAAGRLGGIRSGRSRQAKREAETKQVLQQNGSTDSSRNEALGVEPPSRPVPSPSGHSGGDSSPSPVTQANPPQKPTETDEPPQRCRRHADNPDPPDCGACAGVRRRHQQWRADQLVADQRRRSQEARQRAELAAAAAAACRICDPAGRLPSGTVCTHDPARVGTGGAAMARAALTKPTPPEGPDHA